jgi:hypothetical protein
MKDDANANGRTDTPSTGVSPLRTRQIDPGWFVIEQDRGEVTAPSWGDVGRLHVTGFTDGSTTEEWYLNEVPGETGGGLEGQDPCFEFMRPRVDVENPPAMRFVGRSRLELSPPAVDHTYIRASCTAPVPGLQFMQAGAGAAARRSSVAGKKGDALPRR